MTLTAFAEVGSTSGSKLTRSDGSDSTPINPLQRSPARPLPHGGTPPPNALPDQTSETGPSSTHPPVVGSDLWTDDPHGWRTIAPMFSAFTADLELTS